MAPPRLQYSTLFSATYADKASGGASTLVTASLRDGDDEDGSTGHEVEVWGVAPVLHVPDDPDDAGACQSLTTMIGGTPVCLGTRDLRAVKAMPALARGDAAFVCPTGRVAFLAKKDGTVGILQRGDGDTPDSSLLFEPDGAFVMTCPWGQIVFDADGFRVIGKNGEAFGLGDNDFTVTASKGTLAIASLGFGVAPSVPLTAVAAGAGAVPVNSIFFTPG